MSTTGLVPAASVAYPTAPICPPWAQLPNEKPRQWRMLQFGPYLFPITFQMRNQEQKLALIKKKIPFTPGDFNPGNTSLGGRTMEFYGTIGVGMIGFNGSQITSQEGLETERQMLTGLQSLGRQSLYIGPDQFIWAYLEDFTFTYVDGTGFRYADWTAKFYCDDPRWYGASSYSQNSAGSVQGGLPNMNVLVYTHYSTGSGPVGGNPHTVVQNGNEKSFPIILLTINQGAYGQPQFGISTVSAAGNPTVGQMNAGGMAVTFSKMTSANNAQMQPGDQLIVMCDPRPEYQLISATYCPGGGWPSNITQPVNAWQFVVPATDLINNVDFQYFLPWISSSTIDDGSGGMNTFYLQANATDLGSGVGHTVELMYFDTYI